MGVIAFAGLEPE